MSDGIDLTASVKIKAIKELGEKVDKLDSNLQKQNVASAKLTKAMYFLSGIVILLMVVQILIAVKK